MGRSRPAEVAKSEQAQTAESSGAWLRSNAVASAALRDLAAGNFSVRLHAADGISEHAAQSFNTFVEQLEHCALETAGSGSDAKSSSMTAATPSRDAFVGALSHEFRTPLNAILGWAHLLRSAELNSHKQASALESIDRNARLLAKHIAELLEAARVFVGLLATCGAGPELHQTLSNHEGMELP